MVSQCIWTLGRLSLRGITAFFISFIVVLHFKEASSFVPFNFHVFTKQLKMPMPTRMFKECFWVVLQIKCREAEPSPAQPSPAWPPAAAQPSPGTGRPPPLQGITPSRYWVGWNSVTWFELFITSSQYQFVDLIWIQFQVSSSSSGWSYGQNWERALFHFVLLTFYEDLSEEKNYISILISKEKYG